MLFYQHIIRQGFQRPVISMFHTCKEMGETTITIDGKKVSAPLTRDDWNSNFGKSSIAC